MTKEEIVTLEVEVLVVHDDSYKPEQVVEHAKSIITTNVRTADNSIFGAVVNVVARPQHDVNDPEDPGHTLEGWRDAVVCDYTQSGYWDWVEAQKAMVPDDTV